MTSRNKSNFLYAIFLAMQLGFLIAVPLIGFLLLGLFLDGKFGSFPLFVFLAIVSSFVFLFFEIRHFLLPFLEKRK